MVETVAVVVETGFEIVVFCREAMAEEAGEWAGLRDGVAECVICVLRNRVASRVKVAGDITIVVVERDVDSTIDRKV